MTGKAPDMLWRLLLIVLCLVVGAQAQSGTRKYSIARLQEWPGPVVFSPDGKRLAMITIGGVNVWDVASRRKLQFLAHANTETMNFSSDGQRLALSASRETLSLWEVDSGKRLWQTNSGRKGIESGCLSVTFDYTGSKLFTVAAEVMGRATKDENLRCWDAGTGKQVWSCPATVTYVSGDGRYLAVSGETPGQGRILDSTTGKELQNVPGEPLGFSDQGLVLRAADQLQTMAIPGYGLTPGPATIPYSLLWVARNGTVVMRDDQGNFQFLPSGKSIRSSPTNRFFKDFSPDERFFVTTDMEAKPQLWETAQARLLFSCDNVRTGFCFSPDSKSIVFYGGNEVVLVDTKTFKTIARFKN